MRTLGHVRHFERLSAMAFGQPVAERHFSMALRWKDYGVHPLCASCRRSCKVAGAAGELGFSCMDYQKRRTGNNINNIS